MKKNVDQISFEITEKEAPGLYSFISSQLNACEDPHVRQVLEAQAEMIAEKFHVNENQPPDMMGDITAFHEKFELGYNGKPRMLDYSLNDFRLKFMQEEIEEWAECHPKLQKAKEKGDHRRIAALLNKQLDALVDEAYVVLGTAYLQFGPTLFNEAWKRVHHANMQKVRAKKEGDPRSHRDSSFDVVKPEGWVPPDHYDLVKDHAHLGAVDVRKEDS